MLKFSAVLLGLVLSWAPAFADSNCNVQVDCSTHVITVLGQQSRIDCGKPGHNSVNGTGIIGGLHNGPIVHDGVEIVDFPGMGASGGGKVFHCTANGPKGLDDSNGCIHVSPTVLSQLKGCQGSTLSITGVGAGATQPSASQLAVMNTVNQQYYGTNDTPATFTPDAGADPFAALINGLLGGTGASQ